MKKTTWRKNYKKAYLEHMNEYTTPEVTRKVICNEYLGRKTKTGRRVITIEIEVDSKKTSSKSNCKAY